MSTVLKSVPKGVPGVPLAISRAGRHPTSDGQGEIPPAGKGPAPSTRGKGIRWISRDNILVYAIIFVFMVFSVTARGFFNVNNFFTILRSMSIITVLGVGITFVITAREIDLSIGTLPAMCGAIAATMLEAGLPWPAALLLAVGGAALIGMMNGLIISHAGVPSIIITLATNMIAGGLANIITSQHAIIVSNQTFLDIFGTTVFGFPIMVIWMLALGALGWFILHRTKFGRNIAFIGDNRAAAFYAGIDVGGTIVLAFVICGFYSFMAAMLGVAQAGNTTPWMITESFLTAIAAALIGGTSLAGGQGNMVGTILGAFFLTLITNGFLILGIEQWVLYLINGVVIIATLSWRYLSREQN